MRGGGVHHHTLSAQNRSLTAALRSNSGDILSRTLRPGACVHSQTHPTEPPRLGLLQPIRTLEGIPGPNTCRRYEPLARRDVPPPPCVRAPWKRVFLPSKSPPSIGETAGFYARRKLCSPLSLASAVRRTRTNRKHHLGLVLLPAPNTLTTAPRAHERPT
jgi:hypothetical protein